MLEDTAWTPGISPEVIKAAKEEEAAQKKESARVIDIEDIAEDFSLFSWGWSEPLKVTRNGKAQYIRVPIKSVGIAELMESYQSKMPAPPASRKMIKRDSQEAKEFGYRHDTLILEVNEADSKYLEDKRKHDNEAGQEIVLRGIALDLKWNGQVVLVGKDTTVPNEIIDREGALKAFRKIGFTSEQFASIVRSIRELTAEAEAKETQD